MDVRCEKCGTEYELDEARLKPGGVTVKCTNCGHMFKIRKRAPTNVGATPPPEIIRQRAPSRPASSSGVPQRAPTQDSGRSRAADSGRVMSNDGDRVWIIRFDNGEQKTCRELATLQQWIVSGTVTRESMISRTGKTWKRLGDIAELSSFFIVADEARQQRMARDSGRVTAPVQTQGKPDEPVRTTQVGVASGPKAVAQTKARDEVTQAAVPRSIADAGARPAGAPARAATPLPSSTATGLAPGPGAAARPSGAAAPATLGALPATPPGAKPSVLQTVAATPAARAPAGRPPTAPQVAVPAAIAPRSAPLSAPAPAPTPMRTTSTPPPLRSNMPVPPARAAEPAGPVDGQLAASVRSTGAWANEQVRPLDDRPSSGEWVAPDDVRVDDDEAGPRGPVAGKLSAIVDEPAFTATAGPGGGGFSGTSRARASDAAFMSPGPTATPPPPLPSAAPINVFQDDDSEPVAMARGAGIGKWIAVASILVIGVAAVAIYFGVIKGHGGAAAGSGTGSGTGTGTGTGTGQVVAVVIDAGAVAPVTPPDAAPAPVADDVIAAARDALVGDVGARLDEAQKKLAADETKPEALALEARLVTALAQGLEDKAALEPDKKVSADLHKQAQQKLLDAIRLAQRATKAQAGDLIASVAMADILRLQGKNARDIKRYLDAGLASKDRDAQLVAALIDLRDNKRDAARTALQQLDSGDGAMEKTGDVRPRFRRAMIAFAAGDGATARQLAQEVLGLQPDHDGARALQARVVDKVASTDPLPPEDHADAGVATPAGSGATPGTGAVPVVPAGGGEGYDGALAKANHFAEDGDCGHAMEFYQKALAARPTSVEALTGAGFCYIDTKQFASAHSSFRTALSISSRYERALWGIAEAYQQQGLADKAIEAYQRYLEAYPDSAPAKKQLERLGASPAGGGGGASGASGGGASGGSSGGSGSAPAPSGGGDTGGGAGTPSSGGGGGSASGSGAGTGNDPFGGN